MDESTSKVDVPPEAASISYTFYRKGDTTVTTAQSTQPSFAPSEPSSSPHLRAAINVAPAAPGAPTPTAVSNQTASASASGMITVHIPSLIDVDKRPVDILADEIEKHAIPDEEKFELLTRIRCAAALGEGPARQKERENMVVIRLLAIAIFGKWTYTFQSHPLPAHVVETPCL
jgi:E3 ubiquitin-protein ligase HUWE1